MRRTVLGAGMGLFLVAIFCLPVRGDTPNEPGSATPGALNYVEGQVSIGGQSLDEKSIGNVDLKQGQTITTGQGKAEVLLTPGVFLRLDSNSAVTMISPDLLHTEVGVEQGDATVEVAELHKQNDLLVDENGVRTRIWKTGFYDFNAEQGEVRVLRGQAFVMAGDHRTKVNGGHEADLRSTSGPVKSRKFDKATYETDNLYRWSSLRSAYLAEANADAAPGYLGMDGYGPGWWGTGWYWDPWFDCYTFIPGDGIYYSPFGWGFYSPWLVDESPLFLYGYGGYGYGYGGYGYGGYGGYGGDGFGRYSNPRMIHHFGHDPRTWGPGPHYTPSVPGGGFGRNFGHGFGGFRGGGFHGGIMRGGGFRGGSGGFHGGGGGFHGGGGGHGR